MKRDDREWLGRVSRSDLNHIHHALRMLLKHPMVEGDQAREVERLADFCWGESVRRSDEEFKDLARQHGY
jgi:hypothetical protein